MEDLKLGLKSCEHCGQPIPEMATMCEECERWRLTDGFSGKLIAHADGGLVKLSTRKCTLCCEKMPDSLFDELMKEAAGEKVAWTKEAPSAAGFYWLRECSSASRPRIVEIYDHEVWRVGSDIAESLEEIEGEWYGPLAPPEAKQEIASA